MNLLAPDSETLYGVYIRGNQFTQAYINDSPHAFNYFLEFVFIMGKFMPYYSDVVMMRDLTTCMIQSEYLSKLLSNIFNSYNLNLVNGKPTHILPNPLILILTSSPSKIYPHPINFLIPTLFLLPLILSVPKKKNSS